MEKSGATLTSGTPKKGGQIKAPGLRFATQKRFGIEKLTEGGGGVGGRGRVRDFSNVDCVISPIQELGMLLSSNYFYAKKKEETRIRIWKNRKIEFGKNALTPHLIKK